jgi:ribonuclease T2
MQYAPAYCETGSCPVTPSWDYFTLHGLWPERADGSYPQDCTNEKFDPAAVQSLLPDLNKYWVSLAKGGNNNFWAHEYEKHGTCAEDVLSSELAFFNATLALRAAYDPTPILAAAGITPSASTGFTLKAFQNAFVQATGFDALPSCASNGHINGVTVCVSKNLKAQSCGSVTYGTCKASTLYLIPPAAAERASLRGAVASA